MIFDEKGLLKNIVRTPKDGNNTIKLEILHKCAGISFSLA